MLGIFLDTEANGLDPSIHRLLEIGVKIVDLERGTVMAGYESVVRISPEAWEHSHPVSLQVNGFTYVMTQQGQPGDRVALELTRLFQRHHVHRSTAVFICQNPSFDRAFFSQLIHPDVQETFQWPYHWLDLASMYWAEALRKGAADPARLPWKTGFSKNKIAALYNVPPEASPHRAMQGVDHLILCYERVVGFPARK